MKIIVHAPIYMAGRAAALAAREVHNGTLTENSIVGIVSGEHAFTIKRNKASVTVWHFLTEGRVPSDGWEVA